MTWQEASSLFSFQAVVISVQEGKPCLQDLFLLGLQKQQPPSFLPKLAEDKEKEALWGKFWGKQKGGEKKVLIWKKPNFLE